MSDAKLRNKAGEGDGEIESEGSEKELDEMMGIQEKEEEDMGKFEQFITLVTEINKKINKEIK